MSDQLDVTGSLSSSTLDTSILFVKGTSASVIQGDLAKFKRIEVEHIDFKPPVAIPPEPAIDDSLIKRATRQEDTRPQARLLEASELHLVNEDRRRMKKLAGIPLTVNDIIDEAPVPTIEEQFKSAFRNNSDYDFQDMSSVQWYRYVYVMDGELFEDTIYEPLWLATSRAGHRIFDASGKSHFIPKGFIRITWEAKPGQPHFVK